MAKTKISEFSSTPANNTDIDSINIAEGCAPSGINDAIRELMAQLKDFQTGAQGDSFNGPIGTSTAAAGAFTTLSATGAITSTLATGTAPLVIASTTKVANLNVDLLDGADWASPAALGSTTPAAGSFTTLGASSTATLNTLVSSGATLTGGTINGMTIGATTASTGAFTTLSASSTVTLSGGTANGVAYLNGSKVVTSGVGLGFDGTNLAIGTGTFSTIGGQLATLSLGGTNTTVSGGIAYQVNGTVKAYHYVENNVLNHQAQSGVSQAFLVNGSEQMRLTSTGLGIGTSSPVTRLEVYGAQQDSANTGNIRSIDTGTLGANKGGGVLFGGYYTGTTPTAWAAISGLKNNATDGDYGGYLAFKSRANGGSLAENMRLDSAGNLGLGVTPSAWSSSSARAIQIGDNNGSISSFTTGETGSNFLFLNNNAYYSTTWKYIQASIATAQYAIANGEHRFLNASGGSADATITFTQAMTLDASGNLLVGTTTSAYKTTAYVSGQDGFCVQNSATGTGTGNGTLFGLDSSSNGVMWSFDAVNLVFGNTNTERCRIDSSGNFMVGKTSSSANGDGAQLFPSGTVGLGHTSGTVTGTAYAAFGYAGGGIGSITQSGTTAVLYNTTSDQRLKENIQDADSASTLIDSLQVRKFDWKADGSHQRYGFVAQELVTVAPEAVHQPEDSEEMMAVDYSKLVPMLVKEIQSLRVRVAQLESN